MMPVSYTDFKFVVNVNLRQSIYKNGHTGRLDQEVFNLTPSVRYLMDNS